MTPFTTPTLEPSVTSWQRERDGMLSHISYLEDCRTRAGEFLLKVARLEPITEFDITEALMILWEAKDQSEARRWPVLDSEILNEKEDQQ